MKLVQRALHSMRLYSMKKLNILLLVIGLLIGGCEHTQEYGLVHFHVQASFDDDSLVVYLDDQEIIRSKCKTNHAVGLSVCKGKNTPSLYVPIGKHTIKIKLNNRESLKERFEVSDEIFLGINYNTEFRKLKLIKSSSRFEYD